MSDLQFVALNQIRDQGKLGRSKEGGTGPHQEDQQIHQDMLVEAKPHAQWDGKYQQCAQEVRDDEDASTTDMVNPSASHMAKEEGRQQTEEGDAAHLMPGVGCTNDEPEQGHLREPVANVGDDLSDPELEELGIAQDAQESGRF
jgi:hypothetical protein